MFSGDLGFFLFKENQQIKAKPMNVIVLGEEMEDASNSTNY